MYDISYIVKDFTLFITAL